MKKARLGTYIIFFTFHVGFLITALLIDSIAPKEAIDPNNINDLLALLPISKYVNYIFIVKWVAIIGIILVVVDFVIDKIEKQEYKKEIDSLKNELNATKAKMFDMQTQSGSAPTSTEAPTETNPDSE